MNLHFHALVLDGVYSSASPFSRPFFQRAEPLTDQDVALLSTRLHRRILRYLTRSGRLARAEHDQELQTDEPLLAEHCAAAVQSQVAIAEQSGASVERLGRRRDARPLFLPGEPCCDIDGFSLHAKVEIEGHDRDGLERLCRIPIQTIHRIVSLTHRGPGPTSSSTSACPSRP